MIFMKTSADLRFTHKGCEYKIFSLLVTSCWVQGDKLVMHDQYVEFGDDSVQPMKKKQSDFDALFKSIRGLAESLRDLNCQAVREYTPLVDSSSSLS